jgi:hypothetical protein
VIVSLMLDPADSPDFPDNDAEVLGRPLSAYPLIAARRSREVGRRYVHAQTQIVRRTAMQYDAVLVEPPLEHPKDQVEALLFSWRFIRDDLKHENAEVELLVVTYAHTGTVTAEMIDKGVEALLHDASLDSAVSVSVYDRWNPRRALRDAGENLVVPFDKASIPAAEALYPDWGCMVLRPKLLDEGLNDATCDPFPFCGKKVFAMKQRGGGPVDYAWQVPKMEYWLKKMGLTDAAPSWQPQPKPQPAPKPLPKTRSDSDLR